MATTTKTTALPEFLEEAQKGIISAAQDLTGQQVTIPAHVVAQLSPGQLEAVRRGYAGVGAFAPFMEAGMATLGSGIGGYMDAANALQGVAAQYDPRGQAMGGGYGGRPGPTNMQTIEEAMGGLRPAPMMQRTEATPEQRAAATSGFLDSLPEGLRGTIGEPMSAFSAPQRTGGVEAFMDPYLEDVVQQQYADIQRLGDIQQQQARGSAVGAGAFGGSRQAVAGAEIGRNILEQQARTGGQLRSAGFSQALQASQQAFENARNRQLQASQTMGNLAQGLGQAGVQQAGIGEAYQAGQQADVNALLSLGGLEQQQAQNILDAQRATALERQYEPYQRLGFLSDIFGGVSTGQQALTTATAPSPSAIQQIAGLGVGLAGLGQAGILGGLGSLI